MILFLDSSIRLLKWQVRICRVKIIIPVNSVICQPYKIEFLFIDNLLPLLNYCISFNSRIIYAVLFLLIFLPIVLTSSYAEIPTGPINVTVSNMTINTPTGSNSGILGDAISQALTFIGVTIAAGVGLAFKHLQDRQTPTPLDQVKMFNDFVEKAYYQSYLPIWRKIWDIIHSKSDEDANRFMDYLWDNYFGKRLIPTEAGLEIIKNTSQFPPTPPPAKTPEDAKKEMLDYIVNRAKKFHLNSIKKDGILDKTLRDLFNDADVKYYDYITASLPKFVERAVLATDDMKRNLNNTEETRNWENMALKDLKRLMIFAFLREDTKVLEIMIKSEINKIKYERLKKASNSHQDKKK